MSKKNLQSRLDSLLRLAIFFIVLISAHARAGNTGISIRDRENNLVAADIMIDDGARIANNGEILTEDGTHQVEIAFDSKHNIKFSQLNLSKGIDLRFEEIQPAVQMQPGKKAVASFAIDPTQLDFTRATVTYVAAGAELYKCKDYDFTSRTCFGSFVKILDTVPGNVYSFDLTKEDPLFTDITYNTNLCTCTNSCTTGTGSGGACSTNCTVYCDVNFTVPSGAISGRLSSVEYNLSIVISVASGGSISSGRHFGLLDKDLVPQNVNDSWIGVSSVIATSISFIKNNTMPLSGLRSFSDIYCPTWNQRNCTWKPYLNSSIACSGNKKLCSTTITLMMVNYTWNYTINEPPEINASSPLNNSIASNPVTFYYNFTDDFTVKNCSLNINNLTVNTTSDPLNNTLLNFTRILTVTNNIWSINCTDNASVPNVVTSGLFRLTRNSAPAIISLLLDNPIDLNAGSNRTVFCNGTANDADTFTDIINVNSTLFINTSAPNSSDNRSTHYTNSSCTLLNGAGNNIEFRCAFSLDYYANNGTWFCNSTVYDSAGSMNTSQAQSSLRDLLAIGITPNIIDFGAMEILQISPIDQQVNITNFGNVPLDLKLFAYALIENDNLSMYCAKGNISMANERYSLSSDSQYELMSSVNNTINQVSIDFNIPRREGGMTSESKKPIYWKLQIPMFTSGTCNGKVFFTAIPG